jgi:autotransporter family porin
MEAKSADLEWKKVSAELLTLSLVHCGPGATEAGPGLGAALWLAELFETQGVRTGVVDLPGGKTIVDGTLATSSAVRFFSGSLLLSAAGPIKIERGSVFGNGGSLAANVTSGGTLTPADLSTTTGTLAITGTYAQNSTGALDINLAGTGQFNQLHVTGKASLSGTLNIGLLNGFVPPLHATFKILTCSARSGQFSTVNGTAINGIEHFVVQYHTSDVTLQVVSGP